MSFDTIRWEAADGVGTLTLDRPEHMNGMTNTMVREVARGCSTTVAGDDGVAVVILTGAGRAFCPGADLNHYTSGRARASRRGRSTSTCRSSSTRCPR